MNVDPDFAGAADHARDLRERYGMQIVPALSPKDVKPGSQWKRPAVPWRDLEHHLIDDVAFEAWFGPGGTHVHCTNIGVICGEASDRLVVIDLDHHKNLGSEEWWRKLLEQNPDEIEPETLTQRTGGGGAQMLFRWPDGVPLPGAHKTPIGVDIRGQGGFAVIAPSLHDSGRRYGWVDPDVAIAVAPMWLVRAVMELIERYGPVVTGAAAAPDSNVALMPLTPTTLGGEALDGREQIMTEYVWGAASDFRREHAFYPGDAPSQAAMQAAYRRYEAKVSPRNKDPSAPKHIALDREGRGPALFAEKWARAIQRWGDKLREAAAVLPPSRRLQQPVSRETADVQPHAVITEVGEFGETITYDAETGAVIEEAPDDEGWDVPRAPHTFDVLDVPGILAMRDPQWLVEGMIIEKSLTFLYGEPGSGKSFVVLGLALALATDQLTWWGREISSPGAVLYISAEGVADFKFRLMAWRQATGVKINDARFGLIHQNLNFMSESDGDMLETTVEQFIERLNVPLAMVIIDTVSRVLPGADENLQKDMTLFVRACDRIRERFGCAVLGVHHASKAGNSMRGSSALQAAGDGVFAVTKPSADAEANGECSGHKEGIMLAEKIKAARDDWVEAFVLRQIHCGDIVGHTSLYAQRKADLEDTAPEPTQGPPPGGYDWWVEDDKIYAAILEDVREAANNFRPWTHDNRQTRPKARAARWEIHKRYRFSLGFIDDVLLPTWSRTGVITFYGKKDSGRPTGWGKANVEGYAVTGMLGDGRKQLLVMQEREGAQANLAAKLAASLGETRNETNGET